MRRILLSLAILPTLAITLPAKTIYVPSEFPTIQAGINAAVNGDTVLVAPGEYVENIIFSGKAIVLTSSGGPELTTIRAADTSEATVRISQAEPRPAEVSGFTITEGGKGGIFCASSSPVIKGNRITGNFHSGNIGGGITLQNTVGARISGNRIYGNSTLEGSAYGSAIHVGDNDKSSTNDTICYNMMYDNAGYGEVRLLGSVNGLQLYNNTIRATFGGVAKQSTGSVNVRNNIVFYATNYAFLGNMAVDYNCLFDNVVNYAGGCVPGVGNVLQDALLVAQDADNFALRYGSPCVNAGDPAPQYNDPDGSRNDIGAVPYTNYPVPPVLQTINDTSGTEGVNIAFSISATDANEDELALFAVNLPNGAGFTDNGDGTGNFSWTPGYSQAGVYVVTFIADDGMLADSDQVAISIANIIRPPVASAITIEGNLPSENLVNHTPLVAWTYSDPEATPQTRFEVAVGNDPDWAYAELWNPAPITSSNCYVTYSGAPLLDGHTYYLRVRVRSAEAWSTWCETSFRMNTAPATPVQLCPTNLEVVGEMPDLWVSNCSDPEGDAVTYDYSGFHDTDCVAGPAIEILSVPSGQDSTAGSLTSPLAENCRYWWRARAFDGYEYSEWTPYAQFIVNGSPEAPTTPILESPVLQGGYPVFTMLPSLQWSPSFDPDPLDTVCYKLEVSDRANFAFAFVRDSLLSPSFTLTDSLEFGTHYWWRVTARDRTGLSATSTASEFWTWKLGDINHSHSVDLADLSTMIAYLVVKTVPIEPKRVGDLNGNCFIDLVDLSTLIGYLTTPGVQFKVGCE